MGSSGREEQWPWAVDPICESQVGGCFLERWKLTPALCQGTRGAHPQEVSSWLFCSSHMATSEAC